jgi:hypothetical protein
MANAAREESSHVLPELVLPGKRHHRDKTPEEDDDQQLAYQKLLDVHVKLSKCTEAFVIVHCGKGKHKLAN